jgi:adenine phosphoribosyltransferase
MDYKLYIRAGQGASDISPLLRDGGAFRHVVDELAGLFRDRAIDQVGCVEGRGFLLGAAVAYVLGAGVIPLRHEGKLKAARPPLRETYRDYTRQARILEMHADTVTPGERVLLVDDWVETAGTLRAAIALVERAGGVVVGIGALMDDTTEDTKTSLVPYTYRYLTCTSAGDAF